MCFWLLLILFQPLPTLQSPAYLSIVLMNTFFWWISLFLWNYCKLLKPRYPKRCAILLYNSAVFICSACHSFTSPWSFYAMNPKDSLVADVGSTSLRFHWTHGSLSDIETVNAGPKSCVILIAACTITVQH